MIRIDKNFINFDVVSLNRDEIEIEFQKIPSNHTNIIFFPGKHQFHKSQDLKEKKREGKVATGRSALTAQTFYEWFSSQ